MTEIQEAFTEIYREKVWGGNSGAGSLLSTTTEYREFLKSILHDLQIRTVLDLGCGYFEHLAAVDFSGVSYVGIDPVREVIEHNRRKYPNRAFLHGTADDVPVVYWYDLVIIKDVFQHLPNDVVLSILGKVRDVKWWLITNDVSPTNTDCSIGGWRPMNMLVAPFNLKADRMLEFPSTPHRKASVLVKSSS